MVGRGARVFERSRVVELDEGSPCTVTTEQRTTVTAAHVVIATNYPVFDRALLFGRLSATRELVVAAGIDEVEAPEGMFITQEQNTRSVRTAPWRDGRRLLIITGEHFTPGAGGVTERWSELVDWTRAEFPTAEIVYRWATQDAGSLDKVPYVGPFHAGAENTWVATSYGGWGMTNGVMTGLLLSALINSVSTSGPRSMTHAASTR